MRACCRAKGEKLAKLQCLGRLQTAASAQSPEMLYFLTYGLVGSLIVANVSRDAFVSCVGFGTKGCCRIRNQGGQKQPLEI